MEPGAIPGARWGGICRAGLSKGLIYHHFAGKDALYLACLRRCCNCFVAYVIEQGGEADLNRYMAARMRFRESFPQEARILFEALITPPPTWLRTSSARAEPSTR